MATGSGEDGGSTPGLAAGADSVAGTAGDAFLFATGAVAFNNCAWSLLRPFSFAARLRSNSSSLLLLIRSLVAVDREELSLGVLAPPRLDLIIDVGAEEAVQRMG